MHAYSYISDEVITKKPYTLSFARDFAIPQFIAIHFNAWNAKAS